MAHFVDGLIMGRRLDWKPRPPTAVVSPSIPRPTPNDWLWQQVIYFWKTHACEGCGLECVVDKRDRRALCTACRPRLG
jgi:hypothetical protein